MAIIDFANSSTSREPQGAAISKVITTAIIFAPWEMLCSCSEVTACTKATSRPTDAATTTDAGIPTGSDAHSLTVGTDGPILLQDHVLVEQMAHFNRERVPERVVHAKGTGAFGRLAR